MPRFRWWVPVLAALGLSAALVGVVPVGVSAVAARARCRGAVFVTNAGSGTVSTIDLKTRTKSPSDIAVGANPNGVTVTPDGKTAFVTNRLDGTVSTIDVKTSYKSKSSKAYKKQAKYPAIFAYKRALILRPSADVLQEPFLAAMTDLGARRGS
jgi:YVTN family beta-propeller protein